MGDFNAHTANLSPNSSTPGLSQRYARSSMDSCTDVFGNELLSLCRCLHLQIANGFLEPGLATFLGDSSPGSPAPTSVIDYMLFSQALHERGRVTKF